MNIARHYRYGNNVSPRPWTKWWLWTASGAVAYLRPATWPVNVIAGTGTSMGGDHA